ncbi:MAG: acyltransferase [Deltaproteobacteria bacterium]|nr:acyltransferase [Deltaproteobacteria bacterium]
MLFHVTWYGGQNPPFLSRFMPWLPILPADKPRPGVLLFGHSGVDFFFTLSGFVMVWGYGAAAGNPRRAWPFLKARFLRIYPTYWAILCLTLVYLFFRSGPNDRAFEPWALASGVALYGIGPFQVPPAETLPYELLLYLFFTSLLLLGWPFFCVAALTWSVLIFGQNWDWMPVGYHRMLLSLSMLEFLLGCLGAAFVMRFRPRLLRATWVWLAAAVCLVVGVIDSAEVLIGDHHSIRNFALPYLALIVAGVAYELGGTRRYPRLLMLLGNASYSIYLSHYYLVLDLNGRLGRYPQIESVLGRDGERLLVCMIILALGVACWALIERPLHALARRMAGSSPRRSVTAAGAS